MRFFRSLAFLKVISLAAAIALWFVVNTDMSSLTVTLPVEVRNVPDDTLLLSQSVTQVSVRVRGPSFLLNSGLDGLKAIRVAVPKDAPKRYVVPVASSELSLPSGLSIASVDPAEVELRFDKKATKVVPIEVPRLGRIDDAYRLDSISWQPEAVVVEGPYELVRELRQLETYPIDIRAFDSTTKKELPIRKPASSMTLSADEVSVVVAISPVPVRKTFRRRGIEIRLAGGEARTVNPSQVRVVVTAPRPVLEGLSDGDVVPYVRLSQSDRPGASVPVGVDLPEGVGVDVIEPATVEVGESVGKDRKTIVPRR